MNQQEKPRYFVGLDLGGTAEFTALAVLESTRGDADPGRRHAVRHLERFPPGTPYALVRDRVAGLFRAAPLRDGTLVIDQTGVGKPVVDLFRKAGMTAAVRWVTITTGLAAAPDGAGGWLVPRKELVGVMQVLLQGGRLKVAPSLPEAALLVQELINFKAKLPATTAQDLVLSWREGAHDDLVLAVAVAAWQAERTQTVGAWFLPGVIETHGPWHRGG